MLHAQDCTTVEDVADWPPPLRRLVEAGVAPRGNTPAGACFAQVILLRGHCAEAALGDCSSLLQRLLSVHVLAGSLHAA
jgi:hypothetical protein